MVLKSKKETNEIMFNFHEVMTKVVWDHIILTRKSVIWWKFNIYSILALGN